MGGGAVPNINLRERTQDCRNALRPQSKEFRVHSAEDDLRLQWMQDHHNSFRDKVFALVGLENVEGGSFRFRFEVLSFLKTFQKR